MLPELEEYVFEEGVVKSIGFNRKKKTLYIKFLPIDIIEIRPVRHITFKEMLKCGDIYKYYYHHLKDSKRYKIQKI